MTFRVGQKVVCVDKMHSVHPGLNVGQVYTVAGVVHRPYWETFGLLLLEIEASAGFEAFDRRMFRPATDIAIFTAMLKTSKERA